ncbi:hypothetical protein [Rhodococcus opacus]|uniref:hypothetical protein n=1 Tax=Rhodococcus opacus TaxID=37919 RepID=UPI002474243C|nr:hypothetical protein [Rhodococcus opacus]MDH6291864.1 hypothetical protein [Rhodococcus opacus]
MSEPWIISDEPEWMPGPQYDPPAGGVLLMSPHGRGHLSFYEGVWYRVRKDQQPDPITAGEAMSLRPLDLATIVNVSHGWMLHHAGSERAWALSDELKDGTQALVRTTLKLAGVLG